MCAKKFALRGPIVGASAKKFALQAQNGRKTLFSGALGEIFRGNAAGSPVLGEFCRGMGPAWRSCLLEGLINLVSSFSLHGLVECP